MDMKDVVHIHNGVLHFLIFNRRNRQILKIHIMNHDP